MGITHSHTSLDTYQTPDDARRIRLNSDDISKFLKVLRTRSEVPRMELAQREYLVLPLLGLRPPKNLILHEILVEDAGFFVGVLCDVYLPAHRDKSVESERTPETEARARAGYHLLQGMHRIPGQSDGNTIDKDMLMRWISAAREKALESDRADVADIQIGEILAHAPHDPEDDGWPHKAIRDTIEALNAKHIEDGLVMERFNLRGVVWKAVFEGGVQERELASQYRAWANISRARWPRMAHVLEIV